MYDCLRQDSRLISEAESGTFNSIPNSLSISLRSTLLFLQWKPWPLLYGNSRKASNIYDIQTSRLHKELSFLSFSNRTSKSLEDQRRASGEPLRDSFSSDAHETSSKNLWNDHWENPPRVCNRTKQKRRTEQRCRLSLLTGFEMNGEYSTEKQYKLQKPRRRVWAAYSLYIIYAVCRGIEYVRYCILNRFAQQQNVMVFCSSVPQFAAIKRKKKTGGEKRIRTRWAEMCALTVTWIKQTFDDASHDSPSRFASTCCPAHQSKAVGEAGGLYRFVVGQLFVETWSDRRKR